MDGVIMLSTAHPCVAHVKHGVGGGFLQSPVGNVQRSEIRRHCESADHGKCSRVGGTIAHPRYSRPYQGANVLVFNGNGTDAGHVRDVDCRSLLVHGKSQNAIKPGLVPWAFLCALIEGASGQSRHRLLLGGENA